MFWRLVPEVPDCPGGISHIRTTSGNLEGKDGMGYVMNARIEVGTYQTYFPTTSGLSFLCISFLI